MKKLQIASIVGVLSALVCFGSVANGQGVEQVFATLGGVELVANMDYVGGDPANPPATRISARSVDPAGTLVTFTNLAFLGANHQVWDALTMSAATQGTAKGAPAAGPLYSEEWIPYDSYVAITMDMVGGQAGGGYTGISDQNDGSLGDGGLPPTAASAALVGFGDIAMQAATDAFFVSPDFQQQSIDIAYIVDGTPADPGDITMTLGILGSGIVDAGTEGGASFGYDPIAGTTTPITVPFVPEPAAGGMAAFACLGMLALRRRNG